MKFPYFSLEEDDQITQNDTIFDDTKNDPLEDAGQDLQTVDVVPTQQETGHNQAASAGGVVVGDGNKTNADDLEIDPVAATELFIRDRFGLSREDLEAGVNELVEDAAEIPNADTGMTTQDEELVGDDAEAAAVGMTTVTVVPPEGGTTVASDPEDAPTIETPTDVATLEGLRRIWSMEEESFDESESGDLGSADVEFDVKTQANDVNFKMEDQAVTIEPNAGGDTGGSSENEDLGGEEMPEEEGGEETATEDEETTGEEDGETAAESWLNWF